MTTLEEFGMHFAMERAKNLAGYWHAAAGEAVDEAERSTCTAVAVAWESVAGAVRESRVGDAEGVAARGEVAEMMLSVVRIRHGAAPSVTTREALDLIEEASQVITEVAATIV